MGDTIQLFQEKKNCCGCSACVNICSKNKAVQMIEDEYGFLYPEISEEDCLKCGACKKVCAFQNVLESSNPIATYVASTKSENQIKLSASGGVFAAMATVVLDNGGVVFGASLSNRNGILKPLHVCVTEKKELPIIQGSKYVESSIGTTYGEAKKYLVQGKIVLFSGTPCQIAGLKAYLSKDYSNLITVDIICHGVPNAKFFQSYLKVLEQKLNGEIIDFKFRDKSTGWGLTGKVTYKTKTKQKKEMLLPSWSSSYYDLFLKSDIYRENCYSCKYASSHRPGDITIGDYWGIKQEHPELMEEKGGIFSERKGISCIILNTEKGIKYLEIFKSALNLSPSSFDKVALHNGQLTNPSHISPYRKEILELYRKQGYKAVEKYFRKRVGIKFHYYRFKSMLPKELKESIKRIIGKI